MIVYHAQYVFPVATPPLRDGAVAVDEGRIIAVGPPAEVAEAAAAAAEPGAQVQRRWLGRAAILPGLINAHTHLELSWARDGVDASGGWVDWVRGLIAARDKVTPETARGAAARAVAEVVRRGTVAVGDVANDSWAAPLVAEAGLHGVAFLETYGLRADSAETIVSEVLARRDALLADPRIAAAAARLRVVPAPHAPHTTSAAVLRALARHADRAKEPLAIHVAESAAESEWLDHGGGPLTGFYRERGFLDTNGPGWTPPGLSPVEYVHRLGMLGPRTLAIHCVRLSANDRALLQASGATVVTCPRSNRTLGVGTAPVPELLREGVPVALGTDSLASCPDLDLFAEMAATLAEHPQLAAATVLRMATLTGARALGVDDRLGSLEPGKLAAALAVPLPAGCDDPKAALSVLCAEPSAVHRLDSAPFDGAAGEDARDEGA